MSLTLTRVQDVIDLNPNLDKFENRINNLGAYDAFLRQSRSPNSIITPELEAQIFESMGKTVKSVVMNRKGVTIRATRPLVIPIDENTSTFATYTFATLAYGFHIYPNQHHNNYVSMQRDFQHKFLGMLEGFSDSVETLAVAKLDADKTQVIPQVGVGGAFAANVYSENTGGNLQNSYVLHDLPGMLRSMRMYGNPMQAQMPATGNMDIVANNYYNGILNRMEGFGVFNQEDKTLHFGGKNFHFTNDIANAAGKVATGYAIADNSIGLMTRVERPSLYGSRTADGHEWGTVRLPKLDIEVGYYYYEGAVDAATAIGTADTADMTRDIVQVHDFAFDICFVSTYNSDRANIPSPIIKFDIQ